MAEILTPGFPDPVHGAQTSFRTLLTALSEPGRVLTLSGVTEPPSGLSPAMAAVALTLMDADTPIWRDGKASAASAWLRFHCGAPLVEELKSAAFALCAEGHLAPDLAAMNLGEDDYPDRSATVVIEVASLAEGSGWRLSGPGIETERLLSVEGLPTGFRAQWSANGAIFPRGVDVIFTCGDRVAGLPRRTRIA
jgi:alpha-D-ribose 1-methylphosphonate 5-triphosphate synthase subunit PhnH